MSFTFYLGTHKPTWLKRTDIPLFISRRRLAEFKTLPRARGPWALDSGAFTELSLHGRWTLTSTEFIEEVWRFADEVGNMQWASIQDWMCEPFMLEKTGLTVETHQLLTVFNYLDLMSQEPDMPWAPVLQGWRPDEYKRHVDMYTEHGVDLSALPVVGVGSVCRRGTDQRTTWIFMDLFLEHGLRNLHAFGYKKEGLVGTPILPPTDYIASADSMAWSYSARREESLPDCTHGRDGMGTCANCMRYAMRWRADLFDALRERDHNPLRMPPIWEGRDQ